MLGLLQPRLFTSTDHEGSIGSFSPEAATAAQVRGVRQEGKKLPPENNETIKKNPSQNGKSPPENKKEVFPEDKSEQTVYPVDGQKTP